MTMTEFIKQNGITASSVKLFGREDIPLDQWDNEANHYQVQLEWVEEFNRPKMSLFYSKGSGHHGKRPTAEEVMEALKLDLVTEPFEDWASGFGYDTDSKQAEATYQACVHNTAKLRKFLGYNKFQQFAEEVEVE